MTKLVKIESAGLIEYNGDFYTAEELAELFKQRGTFDVIVNEEGTWFSEKLLGLEEQ